ncbi:MAG: amidohydrolase [Flavobacteriaceae bacterium]|nr:amidohydrolase [Flavobacteriaceae bacterium]
MSNSLVVAGIQANLFWENPKKNIAFFEEKILALDDTVDLVVLPEMFTSGFTMNPMSVAETINGNTISWMKSIAKKKNVAITGSIVIEEENQYYNRLFFVKPNGNFFTYDKKHTFTLAGENKAYKAGEKKIIVEYKGWKICPLICYDLRFPVWARNIENYDLLIYMANWPVARIKAWDTLLKARAIENMSYTIGVNRIGLDDNNYEYSGNSLIIDYLGQVIANAKDNKEEIIVAELLKTKQEKVRKKLGFLNDKDTFTLQ